MTNKFNSFENALDKVSKSTFLDNYKVLGDFISKKLCFEKGTVFIVEDLEIYVFINENEIYIYK